MSDTVLIARRRLYRGRDLAYDVGDVVPADAYPTHQINALLANGGLGRARALETAVREIEPEDGYLRFEPAGKRVVLEDGGTVVRTPARDIIAQDAKQACASIEVIDDTQLLDELHALERANPAHMGGRDAVIDAIEERRNALEGDDGA